LFTRTMGTYWLKVIVEKTLPIGMNHGLLLI